MKITSFYDFPQSNNSYKRMNRTLALAALSEMRQKHAAILYQGGRVISVGINTFRNAPTASIPTDALSNHAEINCLRGIDFKGRHGVLYVARISSGGNLWVNSAPCEACTKYLELFTNIKEVIHT